MAADIAEENLRTSLNPDFGILELSEIGLEKITDSNRCTLERDTTNHKNNQHQKREGSSDVSSFSGTFNSLEDAAENDKPESNESSDNRRARRSHLAKAVGQLKHFVGPVLGLGENYSSVARFRLHEFIVLDGCRAAFCIPIIAALTPWNCTADKKFYYL